MQTSRVLHAASVHRDFCWRSSRPSVSPLKAKASSEAFAILPAAFPEWGHPKELRKAAPSPWNVLSALLRVLSPFHKAPRWTPAGGLPWLSSATAALAYGIIAPCLSSCPCCHTCVYPSPQSSQVIMAMAARQLRSLKSQDLVHASVGQCRTPEGLC